MTETDRRGQPIQLGIIGTGLAVEQLHWPTLKRLLDRSQIAAFCDLARPAAEWFARYSRVDG